MVLCAVLALSAFFLSGLSFSAFTTIRLAFIAVCVVLDFSASGLSFSTFPSFRAVFIILCFLESIFHVLYCALQFLLLIAIAFIVFLVSLSGSCCERCLVIL